MNSPLVLSYYSPILWMFFHTWIGGATISISAYLMTVPFSIPCLCQVMSDCPCHKGVHNATRSCTCYEMRYVLHMETAQLSRMEQLRDLRDALPTDEEVAALVSLMYKDDKKVITPQVTLYEALPSGGNLQDDHEEYEADAITGLTISITGSCQLKSLPKPMSGSAGSTTTCPPQESLNREFFLPQVMVTPRLSVAANQTASTSSKNLDAKRRALPPYGNKEASKKIKRASGLGNFHSKDERPTSSVYPLSDPDTKEDPKDMLATNNEEDSSHTAGPRHSPSHGNGSV